jgi:hypothetical protein
VYVSLNRRLNAWGPRLTLVCAALLVVAVAAVAGRVGTDARWMAALGRLVSQHGSIPAGVPFAVAASHNWPNVPVLGELIFHWLEQAMGDRGLMLAQLVAVAAAVGALIADALSGGAEEAGAARALVLGGLGCITALAIARAQLFSLALFPVLCWLLRAESRRPSWRVWLAIPLLALWANLHGGVLVGLAVLLAYLVIDRRRRQPLVAVAVALAGLAAVCATPALLSSISYYRGVLTGQAAAAGQAMWAALSLTSPLDVLFIACAGVLLIQFWRARPVCWELVAAAGLALMAIQAGRNGLWLALFLAPTAARSFAPRRQWTALAALVVPLSAAVLVFALARGPVLYGAGARLVARAISLAHGSPVLAGGGIEEQVALAGGSIVVGDPIDAFPAPAQRAYLDWLDGGRGGLERLQSGVRVVLVLRGSGAQRVMAGDPAFALAGQDRQALLYARRSLS